MKIALLGNPNTGKSTVFNMLTGMHQHVGNFPGVTVDKKIGTINLDGEEIKLIDFPGTYSIYPRTKDEAVVYDSLKDASNKDYPDAVVVVVDASNLERNLLFFSQIYDFGIPTVLVLNMQDIADKRKKKIDLQQLQSVFPDASIIETTARVKLGRERLLEAFKNFKPRSGHLFLTDSSIAKKEDQQAQEEDTQKRVDRISSIMPSIEKVEERISPMSKFDRLLIHPVFGYLIFALVLLVIFQFIFSFANVPMDLIDEGFVEFSSWTAQNLPTGIFNDLLSQGIIPGIGGVVIFIPQIALLFFFISVLEESGYLSRVVFIMDRLMRPFGLNGKSVVPLMSSVACAIPGVMATRTISDWKERLITIMVAPLMSCSARIPVYTLLISLVIPEERVLGVFNVQGLVLFGLYLLGLLSALITALVLRTLIKSRQTGFLMLEIPGMKMPHWGNVGIVVLEKVKVFILDAGKIILAISVILWALASYGPGDEMERAENEVRLVSQELHFEQEEIDMQVASARLENSYIGHMGKFIEPVIQPLGYDWKIGISLISSFAAREVFVGSMATIYAVGDDGENERPLIEKMRTEKKRNGEAVYTLASGVSLMVFYVFAMQCMATLAVVKRETKGWKWPLIQLGYMGVLAYLGAWITYILLS